MNSRKTLRLLPGLVCLLLVCVTLIAFKTEAAAYYVEPQIFSGTIDSATDSYTVDVTVDYSLSNSYALFGIRTGTSGFQVKVYLDDVLVQNYLTIDGLNATNPDSVLWYPLENGIHAGEVTYTVVVTPLTYLDDCSFNLIIGDYRDAHELITGIENATPLPRYSYFKPNGTPTLNNDTSQYTILPEGAGQYFIFEANLADTVSIETNREGVRFQIVDMDDIDHVYYDSSSDNNAHLTRQHATGWFVERVRLNTCGLQNGQEYYLVVYGANGFAFTPPQSSGVNTSGGQTKIAVGQPKLSFAQQTFTSPTTLSVTSSAYANRAITVSGLPANAQAYEVTLGYSGTSLSKLSSLQWRFGTRPYTAGFQFTFPVSYTYGGNSNTPANGSWTAGYRASSATVTLTPSITVRYYYELGI